MKFDQSSSPETPSWRNTIMSKGAVNWFNKNAAQAASREECKQVYLQILASNQMDMA